MVRGGEKTSHQCTGIKGSKICDSSLYSDPETLEQHPYSYGKHGCFFLFSKDKGGGKQSGFSGIKKKNLELSNIRTDDSYCQAPIKNFEYGDRLRVQKCEGLKRMAHEDGNLPKALLKPRQTRDRSLSIESVETTQKYISWKTDPFSIGRDAFQTSWSQGLNYAFLTFSLIGRVLAKV